MPRRDIALVLTLLVLAVGCPKKEDTGAGEETPTAAATVQETQTVAAATPTPEATAAEYTDAGAVLVIGPEKAYRVSQGDDGKWLIEMVLDFPGIAVRADADDTSLWIVTNTAVRGYDNSFNPISKTVRFEADKDLDPAVPALVPPFQRNASLDVAGGEAYVSEAKQFQVVSPGNIVSATLNLPKTAHDVLVYEGSAYLIDDIMRPLWVHRVDLSDSTRPTLATSHQIALVNGHLGVHWLDTDSEKWFITASQNHRGGSDLSVKIFPLATTKDTEPETRVLWRKSRFRDDSPAGTWPPGTSLWRVTDRAPAWGLIRDGNNMFVARIGNDTDPTALSHRWTAPSSVGERVATGLAANATAVFVALDQQLFVLDVTAGKEPTLLATVPLPVAPVDIVAW